MKNYQMYPSSRIKIRTLPVLVATALLSTLARSQGAEPLPPQALIGKLKWRCVGPYIGGRKAQQNLEVALDPRLHATQEDLEARLALDLQIHADLDALNKGINQALAARDKLQQAVSNHGVTDAQGTGALAALNRDIDSTVPMAIKSSEGDLLYGTRLRDHLAYLAAEIDLCYDRPTASQEAVFHELDQQAKDSKQKLETDIAQAEGAAGAGAGR